MEKTYKERGFYADVRKWLSTSARQLDRLFPVIWQEHNRSKASRLMKPFNVAFAAMQGALEMEERALAWFVLGYENQYRYPLLFSGGTSILYAPFAHFLLRHSPERFKEGVYGGAVYRTMFDGDRGGSVVV